jgi:sugar lactone lactonase YvrE
VVEGRPLSANGLTRDLQGRLIACEHDSRRVTRQELDGSITVVANSFQGRQLNRPNDVVVKSDGCIYFTDPWTSPAAPEQCDLTFSGVYRVTPDLGTMSLLIGDFIVPNGLAFSPDESVLYINDSRRGHIRAFDLMPNGTLAKQTDRVFVDLRGTEPGVPDGMKVDVEGNVYCGGAGGLWIMDPQGKKLGRVVHGAPATTNLAFLAATTGRPSISPAAIIWAPSTSKSPASRCRHRRNSSPFRFVLATGTFVSACWIRSGSRLRDITL